MHRQTLAIWWNGYKHCIDLETKPFRTSKNIHLKDFASAINSDSSISIETASKHAQLPVYIYLWR